MNSSLILPVLAGLLCAGVVNYLADVLPRSRRLGIPECRQCGAKFRWADYLRARSCQTCGRSRGFRPWLVLIAMLGLSLLAWFQPNRMGYVLGLLVLAYFALVVVIDVEHRLILRPTSVFGAILAFGIGWWLHGLMATLFGGLAGFVIMSVFYYLGVLFSRFRARRLQASGRPVDGEEALGGGDVTLAAILGLLMGWPLIWFGLLLGVLLGGVLGLAVVVAVLVRGEYGRRAMTLFMPYGPAFVASAFLILFLPDLIAQFLPG